MSDRCPLGYLFHEAAHLTLKFLENGTNGQVEQLFTTEIEPAHVKQ